MRITARIASAGERWTADFPKIDVEKLFPWKDGKRVADPDEVRKALTSEFIVHAKKDTAYLQCLAARIIEKLNEWKDANSIGTAVKGYDRTIERLHKKIENEAITYARAELTVRFDAKGEQAVRFDIGTKNNYVVQNQMWERLFAMLMTEAAKIVSEECVDCGYPPMEFSPAAEKMYDDLMAWRKNEKRKRILKRRNERRTICLHHRHGYCSPRLTICPCYNCGRCQEVAV